MYRPLVPCESCRRHVLAAEATCPFCRSSRVATEVVAAPIPRMSRAGAIAFVAGMAVAGCRSTEDQKPIAKDPIGIDAGGGNTNNNTNTNAPSTKDAGLVDDPGAPHAEYGAPAPPIHKDAGLVDDHGGVGTKYGGPPMKPPPPVPKPPPGVAVPAYGAPMIVPTPVPPK